MKPTKEKIIAYLSEKKDEFFINYRIEKLGLFGSFARNEESESSDIDLLIEFLPETNNLLEKKMEIKDKIKKEFNREVDLCREKYIKPYYKNQILKSVVYV